MAMCLSLFLFILLPIFILTVSTFLKHLNNFRAYMTELTRRLTQQGQELERLRVAYETLRRNHQHLLLQSQKQQEENKTCTSTNIDDDDEKDHDEYELKFKQKEEELSQLFVNLQRQRAKIVRLEDELEKLTGANLELLGKLRLEETQRAKAMDKLRCVSHDRSILSDHTTSTSISTPTPTPTQMIEYHQHDNDNIEHNQTLIDDKGVVDTVAIIDGNDSTQRQKEKNIEDEQTELNDTNSEDNDEALLHLSLVPNLTVEMDVDNDDQNHHHQQQSTIKMNTNETTRDISNISTETENVKALDEEPKASSVESVAMHPHAMTSDEYTNIAEDYNNNGEEREDEYDDHNDDDIGDEDDEYYTDNDLEEDEIEGVLRLHRNPWQDSLHPMCRGTDGVATAALAPAVYEFSRNVRTQARRQHN